MMHQLQELADQTWKAYDSGSQADDESVLIWCIDRMREIVASQPKWVDVSERHPEVGFHVWVTVDGDVIQAIWNGSEWQDDHGEFVGECFTHWQEIQYPKPPQLRHQSTNP